MQLLLLWLLYYSLPLIESGWLTFANSENGVSLTHCGLVVPYGDMNRGKIDWGNGLLPDGIKPLPEPMLTNH